MSKTIEVPHALLEDFLSFRDNGDWYDGVWVTHIDRLRALLDTTPCSTLKVMRGQDDEENPIAYMRNEGEPNNLVKCTFACPGAFGVYAHSSKDTDRLDWIERHDPDIRSDIDTDMEQNHWPTS